MGRQEQIVKVLSDLLRIGAFVGLAVSLVLIILGQYWIAPLGGVTSFSIAAFSGLYLVMNRRLSKDGVSKGLSIVLSILYVNVFVQAFELVYHFTFPVYFYYFRPPFFGGNDVRYLLLEVIMILPIFLVRKQLRFGLLSKVFAIAFVGVWTIWILFGFPQYFSNSLYYPQILTSPDPYRLSLSLNFGSKSLLAFFFGSLSWRRTS